MTTGVIVMPMLAKFGICVILGAHEFSCVIEGDKVVIPLSGNLIGMNPSPTVQNAVFIMVPA